MVATSLFITGFLGACSLVTYEPDVIPDDESDSRHEDTEGGTEGGTDDGITGTQDSGIYTEPGTSDEPLLDMDEVGAGVEAGIEAALRMNTKYAQEAYMTAMAQGDASCPYYIPDYTNHYWYDTCTTASGSTFSGYGSHVLESEWTNGSWLYHDYSYFSGDVSVQTASGATLEMNGYTNYTNATYLYGDQTSFGGVAQGTFRWDGEGSDGKWISEELTADMGISATKYPSTPGKVISIWGGVSGLKGDASTGNINAIVFTGVYFADETMGIDCPLEPSGTISVRDAEGHWYDMVLQGAPWLGAPTFEATCDGCGDVYFRGEFKGSTCPSFDRLLAWEDSPWQ